MTAEQTRRARFKIERYYPDTGPLRRELYPKQMQFFAGGATERERVFMAANRCGKTEGAGAYEVSCHLTGRYPQWWAGRRFKTPVKAWAAGDTSKTLREIIQTKLLGPMDAIGTGMIPGDCIYHTTRKTGTAEAIDTIYVTHASGGRSSLVLKSYDQRRESFQGSELDLIWLDEEPPMDIYAECLIRTMTTGGMIMLTFTPLQGMSEVVQSFLPGGDLAHPAKFTIFCTWDEVPHLSDAVKAELYAKLPPYQREARSKGIPALGSGAIYPVPEEDITVADFPIPAHWPRAYGLDVGWNKTAAIWGALDRETDTVYLYSEHYRGEAEPVIHVAAIKARGEWIPGAIDPASIGRGQLDGRKVFDEYVRLGLKLTMADNAVEAGIHRVWTRLSSGRLKVFKSLQNWFGEYRLYRRDENGHVVKKMDHLVDATRYLEMELLAIAKTEPAKPKTTTFDNRGPGAGGWMG